MTSWTYLLDPAARIVVAALAGTVLGLNRDLHGKSTGVRTLGLVAMSSALITVATLNLATDYGALKLNVDTLIPVVQGVLTGIGFIGAGVVVHGQNEFIRGITTASAIFATAGIGVVVGTGHLALGSVTAIGVLLVLEIRNVPVLRRLDARRYQTRFRDDNDPPGPLRGRPR